tara:strand:- start:4014 stop:4208 length:195 start_codon:yes stop_codon:yes gene_type:complete
MTVSLLFLAKLIYQCSKENDARARKSHHPQLLGMHQNDLQESWWRLTDFSDFLITAVFQYRPII